MCLELLTYDYGVSLFFGVFLVFGVFFVITDVNWRGGGVVREGRGLFVLGGQD